MYKVITYFNKEQHSFFINATEYEDTKKLLLNNKSSCYIQDVDNNIHVIRNMNMTYAKIEKVK